MSENAPLRILIPCSHRRHGQDKTVLSCPCGQCEHNWRQHKTVLSCLDPVSNLQLFGFKYKTVLSCLQLCSHRWHGQDKTRQFCLVSSQFPICSCSVSNISRTSENLKIGNWVETRQNSLDLSAVVFTPPAQTRQDSFVLSVSPVWTSYYTCLLYTSPSPRD